MKKNIFAPLALSVAISAICATAVQAKTVYEEDDFYLNLTGEIAFELIQNPEAGSELDSKTDNIDLEVKAGYKLDNGVEVFGFYAFEFAGLSEEQSDAKDFLKDHYIGAKKGGWTVQYGDQDYAIDNFDIRKELDAKTASEHVLNPDDAENGGSKEVLYAKYKGDGFFISASYDFDLGTDDNMKGYDVFAKVETLDDLWFGATYSLQDYFETGDYASYGAQVSYSGIDKLTLGAAYVFGENYDQKEKGDDVNNDATATEFSIRYQFTKQFRLSGGVGFTSPDFEDYDDETIWYVNANYNIVKNLDVYGEVYDEDIDGGETGLLLGISADF